MTLILTLLMSVSLYHCVNTYIYKGQLVLLIDDHRDVEVLSYCGIIFTISLLTSYSLVHHFPHVLSSLR